MRETLKRYSHKDRITHALRWCPIFSVAAFSTYQKKKMNEIKSTLGIEQILAPDYFNKTKSILIFQFSLLVLE